MGTTALGWTLCGVLLAGGAYWLWLNSRKTKAEPSPELEVEVLRQLAGAAWPWGRFPQPVLRNAAENLPRRPPPHGVIGSRRG
jgi:hypothetical protein